MTKQERKLLRQQAEAYAFIYDLRQMAKYMGKRGHLILQRTMGIEETIERRRKEYPGLFQRYFNAASKGAQASTGENIGGEGKEIPRRKKTAPKKKRKETQPTTSTRHELE